MDSQDRFGIQGFARRGGVTDFSQQHSIRNFSKCGVCVREDFRAHSVFLLGHGPLWHHPPRTRARDVSGFCIYRKARNFAQVGEWLKPTDCKSVPPCEVRRFESFPVHQESSEAFNYCAGRVRCFRSFVLEHNQRPANSLGDAGCSGNVRAENLGAPERCAASGRRQRHEIALATV